jgi:hypothetical protein
MRYYIEALDANGFSILGNLDGQAALGEVKNPKRTAAWKRLPDLPVGKQVAWWRIVDAKGREISRKQRD